MSNQNSMDILSDAIESLFDDTTAVVHDSVNLVGDTVKNVATAPFKIASNVLDDITSLFD